MVSLASCCVNSGASQGYAPYQRLKRSRSTASDRPSSSSSSTSMVEIRRPSTQQLSSFVLMPPPSPSPSSSRVREEPSDSANATTSSSSPFPVLNDTADDTVVLKVSILGDSQTGKTSFMAKYVCVEKSDEYVETIGVAAGEKVFRVQNANIAFSIWDLGGHWQCASMLPMVCRDAAAILIMFDLTRRSTLRSVKNWFLQARECNKTAILIIIGTKYDRFVQMPIDIQLAIIRQARFYSQRMGASLFFSSVTHNINIHKIFKVIVAKLFDLPCNISKNLNFGEPIIDY